MPPLYWKPQVGVLGRVMDFGKEYQASAWEGFLAGLEEGWESGAYQTSKRAMAREHFGEFGGMTDQEGVDYANSWAAEASPGMDMAEQAKAIEAAGLTGKVKPNKVWDAETLGIMLDAAKEKADRDFVADHSHGGAAAANFTGEMLGGMADPLNLVAGFIPVIGEQRMLGLLGKAGSRAGRALARAKVGLAEGLAGSAAAEAINFPAHSLTGEAYGPMDSLLNLAGGTLLGGALRPLGGAVNEFRLRNSILKPWEIAQSSQASQAVMSGHAKAQANALLAANPGMNPKVALRAGQANAMAYDTFIRGRAQREGRSIEELYKEWSLDYASGGLKYNGVGEGFDTAGLKLESAGARGPDGKSVKPQGQAIALGPAQGAGTNVAGSVQMPDIASAVEMFETNKAVIKFFGAQRPDAGQHDLIRVMRMQMEKAAKAADASPQARKIWADIESGLGIPQGAAWTPEQEDRFAKLALAAFWKGNIKEGRLAPAMLIMKDQLGDLFLEAEKAGVYISKQAADAVDAMWKVDLDANDQALREAMAGLMLREEEDILQLANPAAQAPAPQTNPAASQTPAPALQQAASQPASTPQPAAQTATAPQANTQPAQTPQPAAQASASAPAQAPNVSQAAPSPDPNAAQTPQQSAPASQPAQTPAPEPLKARQDVDKALAKADEIISKLDPDNASPEEIAQAMKHLEDAEAAAEARLQGLEENGLDPETAAEIREEAAAAKVEEDRESFLLDMTEQYAACVFGI